MPHQILVPHLVKSNLQQLMGGWWHEPLEKLSIVVPRYAMVHSSLQAKDNLQPSQNGQMLHDQIFELDANICKPSQTHNQAASAAPFSLRNTWIHMEQYNFYDNWRNKLSELDVAWMPAGHCAPLQTFQGFGWNWIRTWLCTENHGAVERFECPRFCGSHKNRDIKIRVIKMI